MWLSLVSINCSADTQGDDIGHSGNDAHFRLISASTLCRTAEGAPIVIRSPSEYDAGSSSKRAEAIPQHGQGLSLSSLVRTERRTCLVARLIPGVYYSMISIIGAP